MESARLSAHERFRKSFRATLATGLLAAVAAHLALFAFFPTVRVVLLEGGVREVAAVTLPPETKIPPPPEQIARPATPRIGSIELDDDVTIAPTTFESNPATSLGPPPRAVSREEDRPTFIPYDVPPRLLNRDEVVAALARHYPRALRQTGIAGRVVLWIYIDERGTVLRSQVQESSGNFQLDAAAQLVASEMRFSPAKNRDLVTPVWLAQPIVFEVVM